METKVFEIHHSCVNTTGCGRSGQHWSYSPFIAFSMADFSAALEDCFDGVQVAKGLKAAVAFEFGKSLSSLGAYRDILRAAQLLHYAAKRSISEAEEAFGALQANPVNEDAGGISDEDIWDTCCMAIDQSDGAAAANIAGWYQTGLSIALPQSDARCALWLHHSAKVGSANSVIYLGIHTLAGKLPTVGAPCSAEDAVLGLCDAVQEGLAAAAAASHEGQAGKLASSTAFARGLAALAMAHESGNHVQHDLLRAHAFRVLAAKHGIEGSMWHADRIRAALADDTQRECADLLAQALEQMDGSMLHAAAALYASQPSGFDAAGCPEGKAAGAAAASIQGENQADSKFCFCLLTLAGMQGNADALFRWGFALQNGSHGSHRIEANPERSFELLAQAARRGHTLAARTCGDMTSHGIGVLQDSNAARKWYAMAASGGDEEFAAAKTAIQALRKAAAAEKAAQTTNSGDAASYISTRTLSSALQRVQELAEETQSGTACKELVAYFDRLSPNYEPPLQPRGGLRESGKHAVKYLTVAAHAGDDTSAATAARRLLRGEGVPKNGAAAEQLLLAAAANGHDQCLRALHHAYAHQFYGDMIPACEQKLLQLAQVAFDAASAAVVMLIGNTFNSGTEHIPENEVMALRVFELALQLGEGDAAEAMFPLLLQGGEGHEADKPAALQVLRRGHTAGNATCSEWLAECLWSALLGERDLSASQALWRTQAAHGNEFSALRLYLAERETDLEAFHASTQNNAELQAQADSGNATAAWTLCKRYLTGHAGADSDVSLALSAAQCTAALGGDATVHAVLAGLAETAEEEAECDDGDDDDSVDGSGTRVLEIRMASLQQGIAAGCPMAQYMMGEALAAPTNVATQHVQRMEAAREHFQAALDGGMLVAQQRLEALAAK